MQNYKAHYIPWTFKDILIIIFFNLISIFLTRVINFFLFNQNEIAIRIEDVIVQCSMISLPYVWLKKKYNLSRKEIGLSKSNLNFSIIVMIGVLSGIAIFVFSYSMRHFFFKQLTVQNGFTGASDFLLQLCLGIISSVILAPIAEEIFHRGIVYGFLKMKYGVLGGIILQAVIFTLMHLNVIFLLNYFRILSLFIHGVIYGLLYEKKKSLYPSMISHGIYNFLSFF